jgi:hypothetical protein
MSLIYFTASDPIFVNNNFKTDNCPASVDICGEMGDYYGYAISDKNDQIPLCYEEFFEDEVTTSNAGCCVAPKDNIYKDLYKTRYKVGIKMENPSGDITDVYMDIPFKDVLPNFKAFFSYLVATLIGVIILSIFVSCYEFWLKYGAICKDFHYKSGCNYNIRLSAIDYILPIDLTQYPYPNLLNEEGREGYKKLKNHEDQQGGGKGQWVTGKEYNCKINREESRKPGDPTACYSYMGWMLNTCKNKLPYLFTCCRFLVMAFIIPLWLVRWTLNRLFLTPASKIYQRVAEGSNIACNFAFLLCIIVLPIHLLLIIIGGQILLPICSALHLVFSLVLGLTKRSESIYNNFFNLKTDKYTPFMDMYTKVLPDHYLFKLRGEDGKKLAFAPKVLWPISKDFLNGLHENFKIVIGRERSLNYEISSGRCSMEFFSLLVVFLIFLYIVLNFKYNKFDDGALSHDLKPGMIGKWFHDFLSNKKDVFFGLCILTGISILCLSILFVIAKHSVDKFRDLDNRVLKIIVLLLEGIFFISRMFWIFPLWIILVLFSLSLWGLSFLVGYIIGSIIVIPYFIITNIINFFWIPISNYKRILHIIKSHGSLLTIILCLSVIANSKLFLDKNVSNVMSLVLGIIILYKNFSMLKSDLVEYANK